jgi:small subunit ribosomal protein S8
MSDPIADMLSRIKNAIRAKKESVLVPYSKIKMAIAALLKEHGYLSGLERKGRKNRKLMELFISYNEDGSPKLNDLKRISKPSRRIYKKVDEIKKVKRGFGLAVISTPRGLKTDSEARKEYLGGEVICEIW